MAKIVAVSVENTSFSFDKPFSYLLPDDMTAEVGSRVLVPFGKGNRLRNGIITQITEEEPLRPLKSVAKVLDEKAILTPLQMQLAAFLSEQCLAPYYSVLSLAIPTGLKVERKVTFVALGEGAGTDTLSERQKLLYAYLRASKKGRSAQSLLEKGVDEKDPDLQELLARSLVAQTGDYVRKLGDAGMKIVRLLATPDENCAFVTLPDGSSLPLTEKQGQVIRLLLEERVSLKELLYLTGVTKSVVDRLADKGIVVYDEVEIYRTDYEEIQATDSTQNLCLNEEQSKAYATLSSLMEEDKPNAALLFGVTGSGKTAVFFKLMEKALAQNKGILLLVPEIALTAQTVRRLRQYFGNEVAVIHSGLGLGRRLDEWKRIMRGEAKIVMGTRSAVFVPPENLGLIIMDEEQESSYKSDQTPRFHARLAAKFLAAKTNSLFVMASATPEIESYYEATSGKYTLCTLKNRYNQASLPETEIIDMNEEAGKGSERLSEALLAALEETLDAKEQAILLCNRRGYETGITCKSCKKTVECPNCSVALAYHRANGRLMCHYCGYSLPYDTPCNHCGGETMRYRGIGTQKMVELLEEYFPHARVLRMDADTTMTKDAHEKAFLAFASGEYDILVGTQMVAKGLDFPNVTLVGVLGADRAVYSGDFRGSQRTFNLITQVVGRSGRGQKKGRAIIQTLDPESEAVTLACKQDYEAFYAQEILVRKLLLYPPFCDIVAVGFFATEEEKLMLAGADFVRLLTEKARKDYPTLPIKALGPARAAVYRVSGLYRSRLLLKCRNTKAFRDLLRETLTAFEAAHPDCRVTPDTTGQLEL